METQALQKNEEDISVSKSLALSRKVNICDYQVTSSLHVDLLSASSLWHKIVFLNGELSPSNFNSPESSTELS